MGVHGVLSVGGQPVGPCASIRGGRRRRDFRRWFPRCETQVPTGDNETRSAIRLRLYRKTNTSWEHRVQRAHQ